MIGWLRGEVLAAGTSPVVIAAGGVGYEVAVPAPLAAWLEEGSIAEVWVRTVVRADAIVLYGFGSPADREAFDALCGVSGIGPQLALGILGTLGVEELWGAVAGEDVGRLTSVSGVGPKTAKRVVLELSPRARRLLAGSSSQPAESDDLRAALRELGFRAAEVDSVVDRCPSELDLDERLRWALRELAR